MLRIGEFIWSDDEFGLGKVVAVEDRQYVVEFFLSVDSRELCRYKDSRLRRAYLSPQTRVYVKTDQDTWRTGRVVGYFVDPEDKTLHYEIRFPNEEGEEFSERELLVRCLKPIPDPAGVLASFGAETQFFQDRRLAATAALLAKRAVGRGLTGLLSSSIELIPHQVEVVRRVLEDPVQRYLLADEVGLGKTIEAGVIIRQFLLDSDHGQVVILVPAVWGGKTPSVSVQVKPPATRTRDAGHPAPGEQ